jgi:fatty-acid peroxygenase
VSRRDRSLDLTRNGYRFGPLRRDGSAAREIRLLGRRTILVAGPEGQRLFYDESAVRRHGAIPRPLRRTLFGDGAVHGLDDDAHRQRKAMFRALLTPAAAESIAGLVDQRWKAAAAELSSGRPVVLFEAAVQVHGAAVCDWAGVPADRLDPALLRDLVTIVDGFGSIGLRHVRARRARRRADRWAAAVIADLRRGVLKAAPGTAVEVIASYHQPDGAVLPAAVAGVELLNILRPTIAVAYFAAFAGLALHEHPEWRDQLDDETTLESFAQEVRRFYPFVPVLGALTRRDLSWRGHQLRAGDRVILDVYGTLHDAAYWNDPERFDPGRFVDSRLDPDVLIPQGGGPPTGHRCPGERVALDLIKSTARVLTSLDYAVPRQDLTVSLRRMPSRPRSGFVIVPGKSGR